jgi:hypothetical protein
MKKNTFKVMIIAMIAVIWFSMASCDSSDGSADDDPIKGTWVSSDGYVIITAAKGAFKQFQSGAELMRGTYTYSGNVVTGKLTEVNPIAFGRTGPWIKYSDLSSAEKAQILGNTDTFMITTNGNTATLMGLTFTKQ